jgi:lipid II:glycine glycyltransferase (peptidoglycan interpeptide bridge formation enzyme)
MITRIIYEEEKDAFNAAVNHPIQTWEWGEFQASQGHKIYRLGIFDQNQMVSGYTLSFHRLPKFDYSIGTILRGPAIDDDMLKNINKIGQMEKAIFIKLEPDVFHQIIHPEGEVTPIFPLPAFPNLVSSPKVAFYPFSYVVNLDQSLENILASLHSKTRYNIGLARRHGVEVKEMTTDDGFEIYLRLLFDTTKRQGFFLHSPKYHRDQWSILKKTNIPHILIAFYQGQPLAAFMLFAYKDRLFYPYGASLDLHREVMAPTLLMWEAIEKGHKLGLKTFDMWGCLGPNAKEGENGYGFHRFKQGFGGDLAQFVGTYDYIVNHQFYGLYNLVDKYRWKSLRLLASWRQKFNSINSRLNPELTS